MPHVLMIFCAYNAWEYELRLGGRGVRLGVELPKLTKEFVVGFISQHVDAIFLVCKTQSIETLGFL